MGYSSYTNDAAAALGATVIDRQTKSVDEYFKAPVGVAVSTSEVIAEVNPHGKIRVCRDSDAHPNSKGIVVGFDTTISMRHFPEMFAKKALPELMSLLVQKSFCEDPAVLFAAFNDGTTRAHPLQVGQFESGIEVDDDLTRLPLQGGGGGTMEESAEMLIFWAGHCTSMDCVEKRGQKGYLFILTDEKPYDLVSARMVKDTLGIDLQSDMRVEDAIEKARESFEVFCVLAATGSYAGRYAETIRSRWQTLLGSENVFTLQDAEGAAELVGSIVGMNEGTLNAGTLQADLVKAGIDATVASNVSASVSASSAPV